MSDLNNNNNNNDNDNITFFLKEKNDYKNNEEDIQKMMEEFTGLSEPDLQNNMNDTLSWLHNDDNLSMEYFLHKSNYGNDELFYEQEYTVKDLLKICSYYGLDKDIRTSKCKKQDIIATLVYFENLPENVEIVQKRNIMWAYITELLHDPKMKKYVIF
jgi:hypothetical protein